MTYPWSANQLTTRTWTVTRQKIVAVGVRMTMSQGVISLQTVTNRKRRKDSAGWGYRGSTSLNRSTQRLQVVHMIQLISLIRVVQRAMEVRHAYWINYWQVREQVRSNHNSTIDSIWKTKALPTATLLRPKMAKLELAVGEYHRQFIRQQKTKRMIIKMSKLKDIWRCL